MKCLIIKMSDLIFFGGEELVTKKCVARCVAEVKELQYAKVE
jgi:hypothetical protein